MPWREATPEDGEAAYEMGCHIWTGYTNDRGIPVARTKTSNTTAARALWERENGPVPDGYQLGSECGVRLCIRPTHHEPMSGSEIAYRTGRTRLDRRLRIRAKVLAVLGVPKARIAEALNVSPRTIGRVLNEPANPIREEPNHA
jgi:hypothetical protein